MLAAFRDILTRCGYGVDEPIGSSHGPLGSWFCVGLGDCHLNRGGGGIDQVFGQVGEDLWRLLAEGRKTLRIGSEGFAQVEIFPGRVKVGMEPAPGRCPVTT